MGSVNRMTRSTRDGDRYVNQLVTMFVGINVARPALLQEQSTKRKSVQFP